MADFTKTAINQNAKREYTTPIASVAAFNEVVTAFKNDTTMGITITPVSFLYKGKVSFFDENSDEKGYLFFYAESEEQYNSLAEILSIDSIAEAANGENHGGSSSESVGYTAKFSCTNTVGEKEDAFTVTIGKDYMLITGYSYDATLSAIETWTDNQPALA